MGTRIDLIIQKSGLLEEPAAEPASEIPVPEGWLPDPTGGARLRFWDGARWTDHTHE